MNDSSAVLNDVWREVVVNPDYSIRPDPSHTVKALKEIISCRPGETVV
jgi:hypothetical protein